MRDQAISEFSDNRLLNQKLIRLSPLVISYAALAVLRSPVSLVIELAIFLFFCLARSNYLLALIFIVTTYTNYLAPMDNTLRLSTSYPSIFTYKVGPLSIYDIMIITLSLVFLIRAKPILPKNIRLELGFGTAFLILSIVSTFNPNPYVTLDASTILFIFRGYLIFFIVLMLLMNLRPVQRIMIARLAVISSISLMALSLIFPSSDPLTRTVLGIKLTTAFAGDEYNTIILLLIAATHKRRWRLKGLSLFSAIFLALMAARKAAIPYFIFGAVALKEKKSFGTKIFLLFEHFLPFILMLFAAVLLVPDLMVLFIESLGLFKSTLSSLGRILGENTISLLSGIGPYNKYFAFDLSPLFDHVFSFGLDAGRPYKYRIWFLPYGRLLLNFGIVGLFLSISYIYVAIRSRPRLFYIRLWAFYMISMNFSSIILITSLAIAYSVVASGD